MDYHQLKPLSPDQVASALVNHWTETLEPSQLLQSLFNGQALELDVPPPLKAAFDDKVNLSLEIVSRDPKVGIAYVSACRRRGGLATEVWSKLAPFVCYPCTEALWIERADLRQFVMQITATLVRWKAPAEWVDKAVDVPWVAENGTEFYYNLVRCAQIAAVPCIRSARNPSIKICGEVGVAVMKRDKVLLFYLLFFGPFCYVHKIPSDAPESFRSARDAPWMKKYQAAARSLSTTP